MSKEPEKDGILSPLEKLGKAVTGDLSNRKGWEKRQRLWYQMRHHGLRRKYKPFPYAADLHWPLADTIIKKKKPILFEQLFMGEMVCQFIPWKEQSQAQTMDAMMYYDYNIRHRSNFETEMMGAIDTQLMAGLAFVKNTWNVDKSQLQFEYIHPLYVVVPQTTTDFQEGYRLTHIIPMSQEDYEQYVDSRGYNQSGTFLSKIAGTNDSASSEEISRYEEAKRMREGLVDSSSIAKVLVCETYERIKGKWMVTTWTPLDTSQYIKDPTEFLYDHGELPFTAFVTEIKDKGIYSARGVPENIADYEASLCKLWNEKHDAMTFYNRPMFRAETELPNTFNLRMSPGQVLPFGVAPVSMTQPPYSFDQEMTQTRFVAEQREGIPDLAMNNPQSVRKESPTATQIHAITSFASVAVNLDTRLFRLCAAKLHRQCWSLLKQFAPIQGDDKSLQFMSKGKPGMLDKQVFDMDYMIQPSGSADGLNKEALMQKAIARKQLFTNDPHINQKELDRSVLVIDDPEIVPLLLQDTQESAGRQAEEQAKECLLLEQGWPVQIQPEDDDAIHAQTVMQRLEMLGHTGRPVDPVAQQRLQEHFMMHYQRMQKTNPQAYQQFTMMLKKQAQPQPAMAA